MPASPSDGSRQGELPEDVVETLFASERRERMLTVLAERSGPIVLDDLMRTVLARERGGVPGEITAEESASARMDAYEEHLPKLTAVDVVRYDSLLDSVELIDESVARRLDRAV